MAAPKPITLTQTDAEDYAGPDPQPFTVVGALPVPAGLQAVSADEVSDATDVEGLLVDHNDLVARFNALLVALKA